MVKLSIGSVISALVMALAVNSEGLNKRAVAQKLSVSVYQNRGFIGPLSEMTIDTNTCVNKPLNSIVVKSIISAYLRVYTGANCSGTSYSLSISTGFVEDIFASISQNSAKSFMIT
ncbi:hypothetical protein AYI70_g4599 [Smittium culicis]|uniref:Uncharacterized protein n=1 Tax=Smittium culicis TaxID=133412 RepID=A0A1R1XYI2_9FUNG|nr:hypothetical protein AYI70_g4599 [Smittium culicis]